MALKIIAAVAANGVIGNSEKLPWNLPDDLKRFKEITMGHTVVQGRKTLCSILRRIHKPLPGRENVVLTRNPGSLRIDGVKVSSSMDEVLQMAKSKDVFVIGGAEVYALALPHADELYLTHVMAEPRGDVHFPEWNKDEWTSVSSETLKNLGQNQFPFTWKRYRRRSNRWLDMGNIRADQQSKDMQEILALGICPFCGENFPRWHRKPILWQGLHWFVTENNYPWPWTKPVFVDDPDGEKIHLMGVLKIHAEHVDQTPNGAYEEIGTILRWAKDRFDIDGGGFFMRFGEPVWTGGTIRHIHFHIAQRKDVDTRAPLFLSPFKPPVVGEKAEP